VLGIAAVIGAVLLRESGTTTADDRSSDALPG